MALSSVEVSDEQQDWVDLEAIFLTRTVHLYSLSPLHLPASSPSNVASITLTQLHLDIFARQLHSHLASRLSQPLFAAVNGTRSQLDSSVVQIVQASFIKNARLVTKGTPKPFAVEIQIKQPDPTNNRPDRTRIETAHLVLFSTHNRESQTHYPVLFYKAPLSARAAPSVEQPPQNGDLMEVAQPALTARLLTSETLYFVAAYFDCRLSTLAPLHSIRGKNLEDVAEGVVAYARRQSSHLPMELTFALPNQVQPFDDSETRDGPAPELNTISLSVPGAITEELLNGCDPDEPVIPAIQQYLSQHASIHLDRLTLTRVGVASVFLGAPTTTVTPSGRPSSAEVRLKISRDVQDRSQEDLIETVLLQLVRVAAEEEW